jgi:hypothetical protein
MSSSDPLDRRAQRLLRWYPASWRQRYGDEFSELLAADLEERPRSPYRTFDVIRSGLLARISVAGIAGPAQNPSDQARASLSVVGCALAIFLALGVAMWSQLTIGWQWSAPSAPATTVAIVTMSVVVLGFATLAVLAALPIAWNVGRAMVRRESRGLGRPLILVAVSLAILIGGAHHLGNGWPGTGGHPWAHQGLVPGGVAAFSWASTLSVTAYWAHPGALLSFPILEVAYMVVSPMAMAALAVGTVKIVRRVPLSHRAVRFELLLSQGALVGMATFLGAAAWWITDGGPGPRNLFPTGSVDQLTVVAMAGALVLAVRAIRRSRQFGAELHAA